MKYLHLYRQKQNQKMPESVNSRRNYYHLYKANRGGINEESWCMIIVHHGLFKRSLSQPASPVSADPLVQPHHSLAHLLQITCRHATFTTSSAKYFQLPQPELLMLSLNA